MRSHYDLKENLVLPIQVILSVLGIYGPVVISVLAGINFAFDYLPWTVHN